MTRFSIRGPARHPGGPPFGRVLAFAIVAAAIAGCQQRPSTEQRRVSAAAWSGHWVGSETLQQHVGRRTALMVTPWGAVGCAVAIDARGYLLTSAHGLTDGAAVSLVRLSGARWPQSERAEVVWRGDVEQGGPDLALLRVARPLAAVFAWAAPPPVGSPVFAMGSQRHEAPGPPAVLIGLAGRVRRLTPEPGAAGGWRVEHDAPLQPGDSGGPVVDATGRLVAVSYATARRVLLPGVGWSIGAWAYRPPAEAIERRIAEAERRRLAAPSLGAMSGDGGGGR